MDLEYQQYREEWEKLPEACVVSDFPLHLDIELTNRCNLKCEMCPHHGKDKINERIPQDMDFNLYKEIIDEGSKKGLRAIKLNYGGESTLYPHLIEAIRYAKKKGILDVQLNTNGLLLDEVLSLRLIDSGIDLIIITDYHSNKQFENIKILSESRNFFSEEPKIRIMIRDRDESYKWTHIADEIVKSTYYLYDLKEDFSPSDFKCTQPWQRFLILADGQVCSCSCGIFLQEKIIGNAWTQSLESLWKGKKMMFLRNCHENGLTYLLRQCRACPARKEYIKSEKI